MYVQRARPNRQSPAPHGSAPTANSHGYSGVRNAQAKISVPTTASKAALTMLLTVRSRSSAASIGFLRSAAGMSGRVRCAKAGLPWTKGTRSVVVHDGYEPRQGEAG